LIERTMLMVFHANLKKEEGEEEGEEKEWE
jgi:hypothetical protein